MKRICTLSFAALLAALFGAPSTHAAMRTFQALADGAQETPPVATPGFGSSLLTIDDTTGDWNLNGTFSNLIGTSNNAHIHGPAPVGTPAGVIVGLTFDFGVTSGNISGAGTFTAPQMADLFAELYYVNIHSSFRPGGEIRGQLVEIPEPASMVLLAGGAIAVLAIARKKRTRRAA
jgi:hypothetical protein